MTILLIPADLAGQRLDSVAARISGYSRSRVAELIAAGEVTLDSKVVTKPATPVAGGELLEFRHEPRPTEPTFQPRTVAGMRIVAEDPHIVVVDKPAGVAAHPSLGWDGPSVTEHLAASGVAIATSGAPERQGVVQRLDVGTTGLMVLAKSEVAYSRLKQAFRDRNVSKVYHALAQGRLDPFVGTIDAPIGRHPRAEWKMAIVSPGRSSITHYQTLAAYREASLLEIKLETGRTHQIRVHLSSVGHPCCGDDLYGCDPKLAARLGLQRQWLHAVSLGFEHPATGDWVEFESAYPADLAAALRIVSD
ncbi:MAG: RNA pseudouridine synthase [Arachnia propionica]|nr:MAG: RNA pseudouridine synthase [Arachnia propionica]